MQLNMCPKTVCFHLAAIQLFSPNSCYVKNNLTTYITVLHYASWFQRDISKHIILVSIGYFLNHKIKFQNFLKILKNINFSSFTGVLYSSEEI